MSRKKKTIFIVIACVALAVVASAIVIICSLSRKESGDLKIKLLQNIPEAYIGETYDVGKIIEQEKGVQYSMNAYYQNYYEMKEYVVTTKGLTFCPKEEFDISVEIFASKGRQKVRKIIEVPVTYQADAIDALLESNGTLGWADTGIVKTLTRDEIYLKAEDSHTALDVSFRGSDSHDFGTTLFGLAHFRLVELWSDQTWDNAVLTFWVYNPMPESFEFQLRISDSQTGLVDTDWNHDESAYRQIAEPGEWTQVCFSMRKLGITHPLTVTEDLTKNDTLNVKIQYAGRADWQSMENLYDYQLYIDGVDIVDASNFPELDTEMETSNETVEQGWENMPQDKGWQGVVTKYNYHVIQGEGSTCSLQADFGSSSGLEKPFLVLSPESALASGTISQLPNMNGGTLSAYFRFENMKPEVSVDIYRSAGNEWVNSTLCPMELSSVGNGWYLATLDVSNLVFDGMDSDEIIRIRFHFTGVNKNSRVYMDTVKFEAKNVKRIFEDAEKDWINLATDTGQTNVALNRVQDHLKAEGSVLSAKLKAPSDAVGRLWFSPEQSLINQSIKTLPDMRKGVLHAWFYFGNQTPAASVKLYNQQWGSSREVAFSFEEKGGGWYYGTIYNTLFYGYEKGDSSKIIRIELIIPQNYEVYIDGFMSYPDETYDVKVNYADLFQSADITVNAAQYEMAGKLHIWAQGGAGYPIVECSYVLPIDLSAHSNITFDVKSNEDAWRWVGIRLVSQDQNGNLTTSQELGYDYASKDWNSISFALSSFEHVDLKNIVRIDLIVNCDDVLENGKTAHYYFDNLAVIVTDPPLTPSNPKAKEEDQDLLAGSFTTGGIINGVNGIMKVSADDTGELSGNSALLIWANGQSGWPNATFVFTEEQDWSEQNVLSLDTKFVHAYQWFSVELVGYNDTKLVYSKAVGVDTGDSGWNTSVIELSRFEGVDLSKIYGFRITVNMQDELVEGKLAQAYIDHVHLDTDRDLKEKTSGDVLSKATLVYGPSFTDRADYAYTDKCEDVSGKGSGYSWKFSGNANADGWPSVQLSLGERHDLSNLNVQFDVKFTCDGASPKQWISITLQGSDWQDVIDEYGTDVTGDGWHTVTVSASDFHLKNGKNLTDVELIKFTFNFDDNKGHRQEVYIDNLKFVP